MLRIRSHLDHLAIWTARTHKLKDGERKQCSGSELVFLLLNSTF